MVKSGPAALLFGLEICTCEQHFFGSYDVNGTRDVGRDHACLFALNFEDRAAVDVYPGMYGWMGPELCNRRHPVTFVPVAGWLVVPAFSHLCWDLRAGVKWNLTVDLEAPMHASPVFIFWTLVFTEN